MNSSSEKESSSFQQTIRSVAIARGGLVAALFFTGMIAIVVTALVYRPPSPVVVDAELEPIAVFPDFGSFDEVETKKQMFFDFLELYVDEQNQRVLQTRERLLALSDVVSTGLPLSSDERSQLDRLAQRYDLDYEGLREPEIVFELLKRVDTIPAPLALAQAANESAWGTSRFALEGNNIFGQWCYDDGCGMVPRRRGADASHEVRAFESIDAAVRAYFLNLNTHNRYQNFRDMRFQMRNQRGSLDPLVLAYGLTGYSARGERYVDEVQTIIQQNDLVEKYSG